MELRYIKKVFIEIRGKYTMEKEDFNKELDKRLEEIPEYEKLKSKCDEYQKTKEYKLLDVCIVLGSLIGIIGALSLFYVGFMIRSSTEILFLIIPFVLFLSGTIAMMIFESIQSSKYPEFNKLKRIYILNYKKLSREIKIKEREIYR